MRHIIVPTISAERFQRVLTLVNLHPMLFAAVGLHPLYIEQHIEQDVEHLSDVLASKPNRLVAVGEIGLDLFMDNPQLERQLAILRAQLKLAKHHDLPVILHSRRSHDQLSRELRSVNLSRGGVVHGFLVAFLRHRLLLNSATLLAWVARSLTIGRTKLVRS